MMADAARGEPHPLLSLFFYLFPFRLCIYLVFCPTLKREKENSCSKKVSRRGSRRKPYSSFPLEHERPCWTRGWATKRAAVASLDGGRISLSLFVSYSHWRGIYGAPLSRTIGYILSVCIPRYILFHRDSLCGVLFTPLSQPTPATVQLYPRVTDTFRRQCHLSQIFKPANSMVFSPGRASHSTPGHLLHPRRLAILALQVVYAIAGKYLQAAYIPRSSVLLQSAAMFGPRNFKLMHYKGRTLGRRRHVICFEMLQNCWDRLGNSRMQILKWTGYKKCGSNSRPNSKKKSRFILRAG